MYEKGFKVFGLDMAFVGFEAARVVFGFGLHPSGCVLGLKIPLSNCFSRFGVWGPEAPTVPTA